MKRFILILALALALCLNSVGMAEQTAPAEVAPAEAAAEETAPAEAAPAEAAAEEPAAEEVDPRIATFIDTWVNNQNTIELYRQEDGSFDAGVLMNIDDEQDYRWEYKNLTFDEATNSLVCDGEGVKTHNEFSEGYEELKTEEVATGLSASFAINENGQLVWTENAENAGKDLAFMRLDEAEELMGEARSLRLGGSQFVVAIDSSYVPGDLTEEDIADNQVGYFASVNNPMDFDVYQFPKADPQQTLAGYILGEAAEFGNVSMVKTRDEINGIPVAWYRGEEEYDGQVYETLTYIMDDGDTFVKMVFWLDGEFAEGEVDAIIQSLHTVETQELRLGTSPYFVKVLASYKPEELTEEDIADDKVGYYISEETPVDFDVYQFSKAGLSDQLSQYVLDEAALYDRTNEVNTEYLINDIPTAWYRTTETHDGEDYETMNLLLDNGDEYVEIVFWMDGPSAQEEIDAIVKSLSLAQPREVELGGSGYTITLPDGFRKGELKESDESVGHVDFWYNVEDTLEMDVYRYTKSDLEGGLEKYLADMTEGNEDVVNYKVDDAINDIPVAWCQMKAEFGGKSFNTKSFFLDSDEDYIEASFWIKEGGDEQAVEDIMNTLSTVVEVSPAASEEPAE